MKTKKYLLAAKNKIQEFLQKYLKLSLHPQKFYLQHYTKGVKFIGAVIKPNRIYIGNRTKGNLYNKIFKTLPYMAKSVANTLDTLPKFASSINSYFGIMRHYNTYRLRSGVLNMLDKTFLGEVMNLAPNSEKFAVDNLFSEVEQMKRKLQKQRNYRKFKNQKEKNK